MGFQCAQCPLKTQCLPKTNAYRSVYRWEHEALIDDHKQRMAQAGREKMRQRAALAEHPFGTLKCQMGWRHALVRGFKKVRGEMGLLILTYNFRRVLNLIGIDRLREACTQRARHVAQIQADLDAIAQNGFFRRIRHAGKAFWAPVQNHYAQALPRLNCSHRPLARLLPTILSSPF